VDDRGPGAPELSEVHRFRHRWEKAASTQLRRGDPNAIDAYLEWGRVHAGDREVALDELLVGWQSDTDAGLRTVMIAADRDTVRDLNTRARQYRVAHGGVQSSGIQTQAGETVGVGDLILTRRNDRRLAAGQGWVKNGDRWIVASVGADGSVRATRESGRGAVTIPPDYVLHNIDLGYAMTIHQAQGRTVDTAHALVTHATRREQLYVAATRGRDANHLYVSTGDDHEFDTITPEQEPFSAKAILVQALRSDSEGSATDTIRAELAAATSLPRLWAEYETIAAVATEERHQQLLRASGLQTEELEQVRVSDSYGPLRAALREADQHGLDVDNAPPRLVQG
jgi:ATP-dependent exoDNAse (exonuclease V) alpha subunit